MWKRFLKWLDIKLHGKFIGGSRLIGECGFVELEDGTIYDPEDPFDCDDDYAIKEQERLIKEWSQAF